MNVGVSRLSLGGFEKHLVARSRKKQKAKRTMLAGLMLTSMVDMFSLLVIFLLQAFSTSPELLYVSKGVVLPSATSSIEMKDAPVLSLTTEGVFLDQKFVGLAEEVLKAPNDLMKRLNELRSLWQKAHPSEIFPGQISLQAHKEISSPTVSQFMALLPSARYGSIQLAVVAGAAPGVTP